MGSTCSSSRRCETYRSSHRLERIENHRRPGEDFDIETVGGSSESNSCWLTTSDDDQWFDEDFDELAKLSGDDAALVRGVIRFTEPDEPIRIPINPCRADGCPDTLPEDFGTFVGLNLPFETPARIVDDRGMVIAKSKFGSDKLLHFTVNADFHYRAPLASQFNLPPGDFGGFNFDTTGGFARMSSDAEPDFASDHGPAYSSNIGNQYPLPTQPAYRGRRYFLEIFPPTDKLCDELPISIQIVSGVSPTPPDVVPPEFHNTPTDMTIESPDGSKIPVNYPLPTASDDVDPNPTIVCTPPSGSFLSLGTTLVTCTATDDAGHSASARFHIKVQDTTAPTIRDLRLIANGPPITGVVLSVSEPLDATAANNAANYILIGLGKDSLPGTKDDRVIGLKSASYNGTLHTVTLTPNRPLAPNQFYRITVRAAGITDLAGNHLDGNGDGTPGDDHFATFGRGNRLSYADSTGDIVTVVLSRGVMELSLAPDGEAETLQLLDTVPRRRSLSGSIRRAVGSDGTTTIGSIGGMIGVTNNLVSPTFDIGSISAMVVDSLLESTDFVSKVARIRRS